MKSNLRVPTLTTSSQSTSANLKIVIEYLNSLVDLQKVVILTEQSTINWDIEKNYNAKVTLTGTRTLNLVNLKEGDYGTLEIIQGGSGSLVLPENSIVSNSGNGVVTLNGTLNSVHTLSFYYNGTKILWNLAESYT